MNTRNLFKTLGIAVLILCAGGWAQDSFNDTPPPMPPGAHRGGPGGPFMASIKTFDSNQDGIISQEEFTAGWSKENEERFARLDSDGDNALSKEELAKEQRRGPGGAKRQDRGPNDRPEQANRPPMPPEGDRHPGTRPPMPPSSEELDANNDGKVSLDEFCAKWKAFGALQFKFLDTNGDAQLTRDELSKRQGPPPGDAPDSGMEEQR